MRSPFAASRPPTLLLVLVCIAVPLASFLSFSVQAMVAKALVPQQGGTAATWMGTTLFFQCALLCAYAGAYALLKRPLRVQLWVWAVLLVISVGTLRLPPWPFAERGIVSVVLSLGASVTPAALILFATSIMLQGWQARHQLEVPYVLYAVSSIGSLVGLITYPFAVEPNIGLGTQFAYWRGGLIVLACCMGGLIYLLHRSPGHELAVETGSRAEPPLARGLFIKWLALAALPCVAMLGSAQLLSAEIGSNPISWVLPLGIYLASFTFTFAGWWKPGASRVATLVCLVGWIGFTLTKGVGPVPLRGWPLVWLMVALCGTCLSAHGWLYSLRPAREFSKFYLGLAIGGAAGGLFANVLAPELLGRPDEAWWAMGLLAAALCAAAAKAGATAKLIAATPVLTLLVASAFFSQPVPEGTRTHHMRNVYGSVKVDIRPDRIVLSHETTLHGLQLTPTEEARRSPTTYYTPSSAVGVVLKELQARRPELKVGVVGLGTGTLATYARASDTFVFWDVDPKVIWLAENLFTFLKESHGTCDVRLADGRKGLAQTNEDFDLVVIDAFSGDAIPPHLLTREALELYHERTRAKNGLVLLHVSNRFADLQPVVTATARSLGLDALSVTNEVKRLTPLGDVLATPSRYIAIHSPSDTAWLDAAFEETEDVRERLRRTVSRLPEHMPRARIWTDNQHAIIDVIDFRSMLRMRDGKQ